MVNNIKTLNDYLIRNLNNTVMITISIDDVVFQYNHWNWIREHNEIHFLKDDLTIGHIIYCGNIKENSDGSISHTSAYHPKECVINTYFGGVASQ